MPKTIKTKDGIVIRNVPDELAADSPEVRQRIAEARAERDGTAAPVVTAPEAPATVQPAAAQAEAINPVLGLGMEAVTAVNRVGASMFDIATAPVQALLNVAGAEVPTLRSTVAERGAFAGEGVATDIVAGGAELAVLSATGGGATRMLASSLDDIARFGERTLDRVIRTLGGTTPAQDVMLGAVAGGGGRASKYCFVF